MTLKTIVRKYSDLSIAIAQKKQKAGILEDEKELDDLQAQIKDLARQAEDDEIAKAGTERITVVVARPFIKSYDLDAIKKFGTKDEVALINEKALKTEVDKGAFDDLVKSGLVSRTLKQKAFREEAGTPRVTIKEVK